MQQIASLKLKAILENIPLAMNCVAESARAAGIDEQMLCEIQLVVDEACANVVVHAYENMEPGDMEVSCHIEDHRLIIRVRDWGRGFVPEEVPVPDVTAPLEERKLGGLGIFLIKQFMDEVHFTFDPETGNELTMVKNLQAPD